jgi:hypothetical protein
LHPPDGCGLERHGTYLRKYPVVLRIARYYCPEWRTTFGLLPDFLASRWPGTLEDFEAAAARAEGASAARVAEEVRPPATDERPDGESASLASTTRWVARRSAQARLVLPAVAGLAPHLFGGRGATWAALHLGLSARPALVALRESLARHLYALPAPLWLRPRDLDGDADPGRLQQSMRPARPP